MARLRKGSGKSKKISKRFVATCAAGLEELTAAEVRRCGGSDVSANPGAVSFTGRISVGYRLCLHSRFASRILLEIARFKAPDTDTLYRECGNIPWHDHFRRKTSFAVFCTLTDSPITHSRFASLRVKDAIVDQFRARTGRRPDVDPVQPGLRINLHLRGTEATLAIDLSGDSLHRRGYRLAGVEAPLKETLAAGIVQLAGFSDTFPSDQVLLDPMCGSGTLLIEAALLYGHSAPGLERERFGFMYWEGHNHQLWEKIVAEAVAREDARLQVSWPRIIGFDADPRAVSAARKNVKAAGLEDRIEIRQGQLANLRRPADTGLVLVNPPYGERLSERETVKHLYRAMGRIFRRELSGWQLGFFSANPDLAGSVNLDWSESFKLFNGPIRCRLHRGRIGEPLPEKRFAPEIKPPAPGLEGEEFGQRLYENCRHYLPAALAGDVRALRIYDHDLPGYDLSVDLYDRWLLVREGGAAGGSGKQRDHGFNTALRLIREVLNIPPSRIFFNRLDPGPPRQNKDEKGKRGKKRQKIFEIPEKECLFLVNFNRRPDQDLPLRLRRLRLLIGELSRGKTFLNLFGGSGTATVHALAGGALASTTLEPDRNRADLCRANIALNGFGGPRHEVLQEDCRGWLARNRTRYGVILLNMPPDAETDELVDLAMGRLSRDGTLLLVSETPLLMETKTYEATDISDRIRPDDCRNSGRLPCCLEIRHARTNEQDEGDA